MPDVAYIVHKRQQRRGKEHLNPAGRTGLGCSTFLGLLIVLSVIGLVLAYTNLTQNLPSLQTLPLLLEPPNGLLLQPTRLYDRTGEHIILALEHQAAAARQYLRLDETQADHFSTGLISATVATADPTFWTNPGYSLEGLRQGSHPTLAQRLVSDLLLWDEAPSLRRNLRERLLAAQVTTYFGRKKLLEWYLNSANYGPLVYGADAASRLYFNKPASQLDLAEAALLAAVADAPAFNPLDTPQVAIEKQKQVIQKMLMQSLIKASDAQQAYQVNLLFSSPTEALNPAPAFTNLVLEQLTTHIPIEWLERGGYHVLTTLDYDLQLQTACAAATQVALLAGAPAEVPAIDGTPCQAARLMPTLPTGIEPLSQELKAAAIILDPHTGQVLALTGESVPGLDPAHLPGHRSGSLLTPFIYLTAFTRGMNPATLVWDIPLSTPGSAAGTQALGMQNITNWDGKYHGPMRLRTAFANDYLIPAVKVMTQIGPENVIETMRQFGLDLVSSGQGLTSSTVDLFAESGVTLLDATQAFGIFANHGVLVGQIADTAASLSNPPTPKPSVVLRLEDTHSKLWWDGGTPQGKAVVSAQLAYLVTHVLSDETARWPSLGHPNPLEIGRPAGAKIGRVSEGSDTWTIGYTPQIVGGVWIGLPTSPPDQTLQPYAAAALWHAIMQYASRDLPPQSWTTPPGITQVEVCDPSGMLPSINCPTRVNEVFLTGNEPTQEDTLYQAFQINRETGRLATVFTPPELVEERVFLAMPSEALEWAAMAGLPTPPNAYDIIYSPPQTSPDSQITSPAMFSDVRGQVSFIGSANGEGFDFYRLQVGQGLNPQQWIQISQDVTQPVQNGLLGTWNTEGLSGLYAVQLLVVHKDLRVETAVSQITVDNQPPVVSILNPGKGQSYSKNSSLVFQANASDDVTLAKVEFYIDDQLVATLTEPPFTVSRQAKVGTHSLRVRATDMAGNFSEAKLDFIVK